MLLPEPVISITSMSWMRLSLILVRSRVKPAPLSLTKKTVNGVTYSIYTHSDANTGANAELWVQKGVILMGAQRGFVINGE
jgi:hypothetical protein